MILKEDLVIHDTLNPKIWNVETNKLQEKVREKIIEIVNEFEKFIEVPIEICDIQLVGSNCSYNWHEGSDLDVHIIANYEAVSGNEELVQAVYTSKKTEFNRKYNIKINGFEVEMYVQDIKSGIVSNGIYSVCDDAWVKEPKPITSVKKYDNSEALQKWKDKINQVLKNKDADEITGAINMLYLMRHNSIAVDGEYGQGNQLFKDIRSLGLLDKLKDALDEAKSKELSLESMSRGQLVNRIK